jgi:hypothetical protein
MLQIAFMVSLKALEEEVCIGLVSFHGVWTCGVEVLEY